VGCASRVHCGRVWKVEFFLHTNLAGLCQSQLSSSLHGAETIRNVPVGDSMLGTAALVLSPRLHLALPSTSRLDKQVILFN
jgi:hypothetical protein